MSIITNKVDQTARETNKIIHNRLGFCLGLKHPLLLFLLHCSLEGSKSFQWRISDSPSCQSTINRPKRISLKSKRKPTISRLQWQQFLYSSSQAQRSHLTSPFIFLLLSLYHACTFPDHNDRWDLSVRLFNHLNTPNLWLLRWLANELLKHPRVGVSCLILDLLNRSSEKLDSG